MIERQSSSKVGRGAWGLLVEGKLLPMGEFRWEEERAHLVLLGKTGR